MHCLFAKWKWTAKAELRLISEREKTDEKNIQLGQPFDRSYLSRSGMGEAGRPKK